jgi:opacity protein-like surface antigen
MKRVAFLLAVVSAAVLSVSAATATATPAKATASAPAKQSQYTTGTVGVKFTVQRFIKTSHSLTAIGTVTSTFTPADGSAPTVVKQPFRAKVVTGPRLFSTASPQRICQVLNLQIDKLTLNLLGLHVDLDKVVLNITANSRGGVLGSLFCALAGKTIPLGKAAVKLTHAANHSGLATHGITFGVPASQGRTAAPGPCKILDLVLGPIHLNLLGLVVDLNQVHLQITAAPGEGVLGDALCSLTK